VARILHADNLRALATLADASVALVYIDPPFNTGAPQARRRRRMERDEEAGDHVGFHGHRFRTVASSAISYADRFDDYLGFLAPRLEEARRVLAGEGSLFVHLDQREVHYVKVLLDRLFGRRHFQNEIIWAYDFGARPRRRWPAKHDTILWYTRHPTRYTFHAAAMDRVPYLAPHLVTPEKRERGKTLTDVWWQTIVPTRGRERTGYPTQKPLALLERLVRVHSNPGDHLLDFFAGSGTFGEAALRHRRDVTLVDSAPEAIAIMQARLADWGPVVEALP